MDELDFDSTVYFIKVEAQRFQGEGKPKRLWDSRLNPEPRLLVGHLIEHDTLKIRMWVHGLSSTTCSLSLVSRATSSPITICLRERKRYPDEEIVTVNVFTNQAILSGMYHFNHADVN